MSNFKCPYCGKSHYREGLHTVTAMYFPPIYKNGVNVNPDRNWHTVECECLECHHKFQVSTNGLETKVTDLGEIKQVKPITDADIVKHDNTNQTIKWKDLYLFKEEETHHAEIDLGGFRIRVEKNYTPAQIKNIKKYFGWDAKNID